MIQKLTSGRRYIHTHRQHGDFIKIFVFLLKKESWLNIDIMFQTLRTWLPQTVAET
jgi:hypothetical protein